MRITKELLAITFTLAFLLATLCPRLNWAQNGHAKYGGTVIIGMKGDFDSFNELNAADSDALQAIENMLFMSLTRLDANLKVVPYLAKSWEFSQGGAELTFHLRQDVLWSDGTPTTAADVVFTVELASNPKVAYPASSRFDLTEKVELLDKFTVRFHFKQPYPDALFDTQIPILPKHILGELPPEKIAEAEFNRHPVGNGPFKLVEWKANDRVVFAANPQHALGRPFLDRVAFLIIPDETVLLTNLLTKELDIAPSLTSLGFKRVQENKSLLAKQYHGRSFSFVGWNNARPLFSKRIRQALTYAINKQEILDTLVRGLAAPAIGPLMPYLWAYDENLADFPYDPDVARRLLNQEGWQDSDGDGILDKDGGNFEFTIKLNAGNQLRKDIGVMIQEQLRKIGVKANMEMLEWNLFIEQVFEQKNFDAVILEWDADFTVNPTDLWHSQAIANGYNFVSYRNSRVDSLLEKGRRTANRNLAKPIWQEFQKTILEECPYTFLFTPYRLAGLNRRVRGVKMDARGYLASIEKWWVQGRQ